LKLARAEHCGVHGRGEALVVTAIGGQISAVADRLFELVGDHLIDQSESELMLVLASKPQIPSPLSALMLNRQHLSDPRLQ
jgi:hypothetical protein